MTWISVGLFKDDFSHKPTLPGLHTLIEKGKTYVPFLALNIHGIRSPYE